ncbi:hypothetical protein ABW21_db0203439 [Orbilia brochopaga]|nr:hypothetical protein ABW21_db0203439 [Drechslerella brochopaga]
MDDPAETHSNDSLALEPVPNTTGSLDNKLQSDTRQDSSASYVLVSEDPSFRATPSGDPELTSDHARPIDKATYISESEKYRRLHWQEIQQEFLTRPCITVIHTKASVDNLTLPLLKAIELLNPDPSYHSDPSSRSEVPFPYVGTNQPPGKFHLKDGKFTFMGRTSFAQIYEDITDICEHDTGEYFLKGNLGWGKSFVLALIACLLLRDGKKVIYIPHARTLLSTGLRYLQECFYLAYARDTTKLERLTQATRWRDFEVFAGQEDVRGTQLIFIIDQIEAFDHDENQMDGIDISTRSNTREFLNRMSSNHILIQSASANVQARTPEFFYSDSDGFSRFFFGGLDELEVEAWWKHHEDEKQLPEILMPKAASTAEDTKAISITEMRAEIENLTG